MVRGFLMELGATILQEKPAGRHIRVLVRTARGNEFWYGISQATNDDHKLKGWVRQQVRRADSRVVHYQQERAKR